MQAEAFTGPYTLEGVVAYCSKTIRNPRSIGDAVAQFSDSELTRVINEAVARIKSTRPTLFDNCEYYALWCRFFTSENIASMPFEKLELLWMLIPSEMVRYFCIGPSSAFSSLEKLRIFWEYRRSLVSVENLVTFLEKGVPGVPAVHSVIGLRQLVEAIPMPKVLHLLDRSLHQWSLDEFQQLLVVSKNLLPAWRIDEEQFSELPRALQTCVSSHLFTDIPCLADLEWYITRARHGLEPVWTGILSSQNKNVEYELAVRPKRDQSPKRH